MTCLRILVAVILACACFPLEAAAAGPDPAPSTVRIVEKDQGYELLVNGARFHVKGAGIELGSQEALVASGGNSFRTWSSSDRRKVRDRLDRAHRNGLFVAMGIDIAGERRGFDYDDKEAVAVQLQRVRSEVTQFKDHPAVLMWVVGNELNLESTNPAVWNAVNQAAEMIHQVDPNHPVMTTLAGFDAALISLLKQRASALDLIGIQLYGDIVNLPEKLRQSAWTGPYLVTEWGPTGHWESPVTSSGAPIEDHSTRKAELLVERYQRYIAPDQLQGLGSYVFLWGNKQERTPTWYGQFLASGEATASVDAMQFLWTGRWPDNRSPEISAIELEARQATQDIRLQPNRVYDAQVRAEDRDGDALTYRWRVLEESSATSIGGDREEIPHTVRTRISDAGAGSIRLKAPARPGLYRLFVEVRDGRGHAAYANLPFRVDAEDAAR